MRYRNETQWVFETDHRLTINQQLGGVLYDYISSHTVRLSNGRSKLLMSCIRDDTGMSDPTLRSVFRGETDKMSHYLRVLCSVQEWLPANEYADLGRTFSEVMTTYFHTHGEEFLDEQRQCHRPRRKNLKP